jgi:hypothetical protein
MAAGATVICPAAMAGGNEFTEQQRQEQQDKEVLMQP